MSPDEAQMKSRRTQTTKNEDSCTFSAQQQQNQKLRTFPKRMLDEEVEPHAQTPDPQKLTRTRTQALDEFSEKYKKKFFCSKTAQVAVYTVSMMHSTLTYIQSGGPQPGGLWPTVPQRQIGISQSAHGTAGLQSGAYNASATDLGSPKALMELGILQFGGLQYRGERFGSSRRS